MAHNSFGFDVFKELLNTEEKGKNIFISPSSIALALSMTYNGADGETKEKMAKTMHIAVLNLEELNKASSQLMTDLQNADPKVEIAIANSIWAEQSVKFKADFIKINENYY